jgi:transposase
MKKECEANSRYATNIGKAMNIRKGTKLDPTLLQEVNRYILGIHDIYGYIYDLLNFTNPFPWPKRREYSAKILKEIVLCRIAYPCSKRASTEKLNNDFGVSLNLDHVYQMMDKIDEVFCDRIQERSLIATLSLTKEKLKVLFYDATTLYFESFKEDDFKQNGYSKDMKFNQPQVLFALFVTKDGLPVGYEVFPGATYEGHTLKPVLEKLKNRYQIDEMIFVADRGMLSEENLNYLDAEKIPYIVGARLRSLTKKKQKEMLTWGSKIKELENKKNKGIESIRDIEHTELIEIKDSKRLVLSYSEKRAKKDRHDREKAIFKVKQKLLKSKNPKNVISNYGYQKYLQIEGNATLKINEEKLKNESEWDGLSGVYTNQKELSNLEILKHYRSLWQVEESFRINKHDLSIRPIYHWTPKRIKAHMAISYMAFSCVRHLEFRVKMQYKKLSPEVIRKELLQIQASIIREIGTGKKFLLPSKITQTAKQIYRIIGIKTPNQIQKVL